MPLTSSEVFAGYQEGSLVVTVAATFVIAEPVRRLAVSVQRVVLVVILRSTCSFLFII